MTSVSRAAHNTPPTSNYVAATYVQLLYDYLEARGQDARALLEHPRLRINYPQIQILLQ